MEYTWTARTMRPIIAVGVAGVFLAFMALAWFVFGSGDAVKALAGTGGLALVTMVPSMLAQVEYRLTEDGLEKRPLGKKQSGEYEALFAWDELSQVVPTRTGFKFYKRIGTSSPLGRFFKRHVQSGYSGEVHVETADWPQVRNHLEQRTPRGLSAAG